MSNLLSSRIFFLILLNMVIVIVFTTLDQRNVLAGRETHSFFLPSVYKEGSDVRPREILFIAKYPGDIEVDASWEPGEKKLTITLYDQDGKSLVSKKDKSPVHLVYTYSEDHFKKAQYLGNTFKVEISQSPFRTINGSIKISTPGKKAVEKDDSTDTRGPYGTFIKEEDPEN